MCLSQDADSGIARYIFSLVQQVPTNATFQNNGIISSRKNGRNTSKNKKGRSKKEE